MVIVIMGVAGSGKTTVGRALAREVGGRFVDADDFHSAENIAKMARGEPLSEDDREPWLRALGEALDGWRRKPGVIVLACSALTARSRRALGVDGETVRLVHLSGPEQVIAARMRERRHFMPPGLLRSQLDQLEPPADALVLDLEAPVEALVQRIREEWGV